MTIADSATLTGLSVRHGGSEPPIPEGSLAAMLRDRAARFGDRPAMLVPKQGGGVEPISYAELVARAENLARWIADRCEPGARVAIWSRNAVESVVVQHACALAGMVVAHFNTGWTDAELRHACELIEPSLGFAGLGFRDVDLCERLSQIAAFPVLPLSDVAEIAETPQTGDLPDPGPDAPYLIQFTSGTTGKSKGALLTPALRALWRLASPRSLWRQRARRMAQRGSLSPHRRLDCDNRRSARHRQRVRHARTL